MIKHVFARRKLKLRFVLNSGKSKIFPNPPFSPNTPISYLLLYPFFPHPHLASRVRRSLSCRVRLWPPFERGFSLEKMLYGLYSIFLLVGFSTFLQSLDVYFQSIYEAITDSYNNKLCHKRSSIKFK